MSESDNLNFTLLQSQNISKHTSRPTKAYLPMKIETPDDRVTLTREIYV